ncbi:recombinase family protein [Clostridium chromiireducens]|uniref:Recombinase family protein n=1 Tax=Clostridium chromiireducens TaxID=225345 RepID=A0A964W1J0_9CLOT|nr:recombinase family protein [Clostridium chromiireducens]MVX63097.1 recombinase family protein [Clostridium chromiireducens]
MKVGYIRISSAEQNTARQDVIMEELGVEKVYTDKMSGKNMERPQLTGMMEFVREGDCIIVESISRFARNTRDLLDLVEQLEKKQVKFISQKESIDTSTSAGRFMLTIFGAVAQLEREYIRQRQREGIDIAIAEGKFNGRPKKKLDNFEEVYNAWKADTITASKASKLLKIARSSFYRRVKEYEEKQ